MTLFIAGALFLGMLATVLIVWRRPDTVRPADLDDPNLMWYRQRASELEDNAPSALLEDARLRLIEDSASGNPSASAASASRGRNIGIFVLPVVIIGSAALYLHLGAVEDVLIYRQIEALQPDDEALLPALAQRIAARSARRPDNLQYLRLLGQLQLAQENYQDAAESFGRLAAAVPTDSELQAQAAQTRFVASGRKLDAAARAYAQRALELDPQQGTALGLLGMASFEAGEFALAASYWERLQALEMEGTQAYQMLTDVIAVARERAPGIASGSLADDAPAAGQSDSAGGGIRVSLQLSQGDPVPPEAVLFVFARSPAAATRMPIAVRRLSAGELPLTLRLSDEDSMAGQRLSEAGEVIITAQISRNGQPGEANAAYLGRSGPVSSAGENTQVSIMLTPLSG